MATPAQLARIKKMNEARAFRKAQASETEATKPEPSRHWGDNKPVKSPVAKKKAAKASKKAAQKTVDAAGDRIRMLREQLAVAEANALSADDESPQATVARARARKAKQDPTVRRGEQDIRRDPHTGRVMAVGRDGKMITRLVTNQGDKFFIAENDVPPGWAYQWIAMTVAGEEQRNSLASFSMGGWRPVGMERYPGRYGPKYVKTGKLNTEHIIIEGLGLYERPSILTKEARAEEVDAARSLIRTRNEQFTPKLPEARSSRLRGTQLQAKRSIEGMPGDVAPPAYQIEVDAGLVE